MTFLSKTEPRRGFTLIELLVVVAVIAVLVSLLFSGYQVARESARRVYCANNMRNITMGMQTHNLVHKRLPTGGWGWLWVGDPDRGTDKSQPGGWGYCILPFVEQDNIRRMGEGQPAAQQRAARAKVQGIPITIFNCPSRRGSGPFTNSNGSTYRETDPAPKEVRMDYATNLGNSEWYPYHASGGPPDKQSGDDPNWSGWRNPQSFNGVIYERSETRFSDVTNGLSTTYLMGEKYLNPNNYFNGADPADNETLHTGSNNDMMRFADKPPIQDRQGLTDTYRFGSAHKTGCNMSFCDGSVRFVPYTISPQVHKESGKRY